MISDEIRQKLQNIIRGELHQGQSNACTAARDLLCKSFGAGPTVKSEFESRTIVKEKQVGFLKSYAQNAGVSIALRSGRMLFCDILEQDNGFFSVKSILLFIRRAKILG